MLAYSLATQLVESRICFNSYLCCSIYSVTFCIEKVSHLHRILVQCMLCNYNALLSQCVCTVYVSYIVYCLLNYSSTSCIFHFRYFGTFINSVIKMLFYENVYMNSCTINFLLAVFFLFYPFSWNRVFSAVIGSLLIEARDSQSLFYRRRVLANDMAGRREFFQIRVVEVLPDWFSCIFVQLNERVCRWLDGNYKPFAFRLMRLFTSGFTWTSILSAVSRHL